MGLVSSKLFRLQALSIFMFLVIGCSKRSTSSPDSSTEPGEGTKTCYVEKFRVLRALAVDPTDANLVYVGVEGMGVYKTTDAGQTWSKTSSGLKMGASSSCFNEFREISISPQNTQKICLSQSAGPFSPSDAGFGNAMGPYCSSDGGATWSRSVTGLRNVGGYSLQIDPNDSNTVYYGVGDDVYGGSASGVLGVVYKSADFGQTWTELDTNYIAGQSANRIQIHPTDSTKVFAAMAILVPPGTGVNGSRYSATQYGMISSSDSGASFSAANSGMASVSPAQRAIVDIVYAWGAPNKRFAISSEDTETIRSYVTSDSGGTFTASNTSQIDYAEFDPNDSSGNIMLGISYGSVVRSTDGGLNWTLYGTTPTLPSGAKFSAIQWSRQSASVVYLGAGHGMVFRSSDGGSTWTQVLSLETLPN